MADRPFWHEASLILITAVCGAGLAALFHNIADSNQRDSEVREARRTAATKVLESVGHLADARLFAVGQFYTALRPPASPDTLELRKLYEKSVQEWNSSLYTNTALMCRYYRVDLARFYIDTVRVGFTWLGRHVREYADTAPNRRTSNPLGAEFDQVSRLVFRMDVALADALSDDDFGTERRNQRCLELLPAIRQVDSTKRSR